jgi:two-component system chemotaxis response regulator CheB
MTKTLKVLLVDDSPTARHMLTQVIESVPDLKVIGQAVDGEQAVKLTRDLRPDVILMDIVMPRMDGLEATREIMHAAPTPIVLISASLDSRETDIAFQALSAGALTVQQKPVGAGDPQHAVETARLINTLRTMAGIEVLPADFPLPIVVVQHIAPDFVPSLAEWLPHITRLNVAIAEADRTPQPGTVHLAPGGIHLRLTPGRRFLLDPEPSNGAHIPSGDVLFESVAASYGKRAIGVILTGMGSDGAVGMLAMHRAGAFTIAQDEASSVVFGMPREAIALGAARRVLPLTEIPQALIYLANMEGIEK